MHHTVGKLAALLVVVGVGVGVVIHAQRNMPTDDPAAEQATADSEGDAKSLDADQLGDPQPPPQQNEPEVADGDESDVVPAADKMQLNPRRDKKIVKTGGAPKRTAVDSDDDGMNPAAAPRSTTPDPFASADDGDADDQDTDDADESKAPPGRARPRATAAASRPKIDIQDVDDQTDDELVPTTRPSAAGSRGAVLSLDDPDSDDVAPPTRKAVDRSKPASGPRLLGATDESPAKPAPTDSNDDDLVPDEEPAPARKASPNPVSLEDDLDLSDDSATSSPPRKLSDDAKLGRPKPAIPKAVIDKDDDISLDRPATSRAEPADEYPVRNKPGRLDVEPDETGLDMPRQPAAEGQRPAAELGRTIEIDDAIPTAPPPRKAPLPQITIEKQAPASAVLGRPMVYSILVRNVGTIAAHQVVVEDVIPDGVQVDGSIPQAMLKADKLIWKLGTLSAGQEKKISVRVIPQNEGTISGVATVNFAGEPVRPKAPSPQLKFDVTAPRQAAVGTPVEFNFHVRNIGTVPANGVTIRDVLPAGLRHPDGDDLEYNLGELPAGKSQDIKLTLTAALAGPTINRVVVTADGDVAEEAQVQLDVVGPMLLVSRNGPKRMFPDKTGNFSNTVTNPGTGQVTGVTVIEKIPPGMEFVSAGEGGIYDQAKRSVFWSIKQLNAGDSRVVTVTLRTVSRGAQISVIRASDNSGSTGETTAATKVAGAPALTIEFGELPALVEPGETVKVPVRILNRGSDTASTVRATITVPATLKIVSADGPTSHREKAAAQPDGATASPIELQFGPIAKVEPKGDAIFELTLKAGPTGAVHIDVQVVCDQLPEPIRRQEVINVVTQ